MKIKVTAEHIAKGIKGSHCDCAIARAIKEAVGHDSVRVANKVAIIDDGIAYLPLVAIDAMTRFDTDHPRKVEPFEFDL